MHSAIRDNASAEQLYAHAELFRRNNVGLADAGYSLGVNILCGDKLAGCKRGKNRNLAAGISAEYVGIWVALCISARLRVGKRLLKSCAKREHLG